MGVRGRIVKKLVFGYKKLQSEKLKSQRPVPVIVQNLPFMESERGKVDKKPVEPKEVEIEGYRIPPFKSADVKVGKVKSKSEKELITGAYPLIPNKPAKGESIFAYSNIFWNKNQSKYIYQVVEPKLNPKLLKSLEKVKELLEQRLDVDFSKLKKFEARDYLKNQIKDILNYFKFQLVESELQILQFYIERDFIGLGKIEPLMQDSQIEDISCDGVGIPVFIFHRDSRLGSVVTNITYDTDEELDSFVTRLAQLCGKSISVAEPLVDGSLPDGSRLQTTLATDIARRGSNFTIRKFTKSPLTPTHLINYNTLDVKAMAFLWLMVDYGSSILVGGGTASGKTSLLNVLSLFIHPGKKIISIEDTAELQLPHSHWVPSVARTSIAQEGKRGEVDLFTLLKESFRQRPDYIIVGEVRGREAYILFQQMATGHPSLATIHAENLPKLMDRLTTPPINLSPGLIGGLDIAIFLNRIRYKDEFVRRMTDLVEIIEYDAKAGKPIVNKLFKWNPQTDRFDVANKSVMLKKIADRGGLKEKDITEELKRRMVVLKWMGENNINNYIDVSRVINAYYNYPRKTLATMLSSGR